MIPQAVRRAASLQASADHARTVCDWFWSGAILLFILKSRLLPLAQGWLEERSWPFTRVLVCLLFTALFTGLHLPCTALKLWLWPGAETVAEGVTGAFFNAGLNIPVQAAGLFACLSLAKAWPEKWALALTGLSAVLVFLLVLVAPVTLTPWARHDAALPADAGPSLRAFIEHGGLHVERLFQFAGSDPADVDMEGLLGATHAALSQAALTRPQPQTYAAIGHLLGHYRHGDLWGLWLLWSLMAAMLFSVFAGFEQPLATILGEPRRTPVPDGRSLPVLALIGWACAPVFVIAFNLFDQVINYRADAYALSLTHDSDGLCRWLIAIDAHTKADPSTIETLLFYDHPPLARRLESALRHAPTPP